MASDIVGREDWREFFAKKSKLHAKKKKKSKGERGLVKVRMEED